MATDCENFYAGYRWKTSYGVLFKSECNTCFPNKPPGYGDSRPAGTSNYTFTAPDGTTFTSLDAAWNYYCKTVIPPILPPVVPPIVPPIIPPILPPIVPPTEDYTKYIVALVIIVLLYSVLKR